MEFRQLEHFLAVAECGSFTAAARQVLIVQSALSTSIRNLERELGVTLFERTTRRVVLTDAGRALLPPAHRVLAEVDAARDGVAAVTGLRTGRVAIGTIQTLTHVDLPTELAAFHRAHPGVRIMVRDEVVPGLIDDVLAGELDLAYVTIDGDPPPGLVMFGPRHEDLVLITSTEHRLAGAGSAALTEAGDDPFVVCRPGTGLEITVRRMLGEIGMTRRIGAQVTQMGLLVDLVRAGLGVAVVPAPVAERAGLPAIRITGPHAERTVTLVARAPHPVNPAAVALLEHLCGEPVQAHSQRIP